MTANKRFKRRVRARARKTGESYTAALSQLRRPDEELLMSEPPLPQFWRDQMTNSGAILAEVNTATGDTWELDGRFAQGRLEGAWRVRRNSVVAVMKWHDPRSAAPYNPDAPAVVEYLRSEGYPTPRWLAAGVTDGGVHWSLQELADGEPLRELDQRSAEIFMELADWHRELRLPTDFGWNQYIREHLYGPHPTHKRLKTGGPNVSRLLETVLSLAFSYEDTPLPADEMVHCDLNVGNVLTVDGKLTAVVDIDGAGLGCAAYDLLSPAATGVSWASDPVAIDRLVQHGLRSYGPGPVTVAIACLVIEKTIWYQRADPNQVEQHAERHLDWVSRLEGQLRE